MKVTIIGAGSTYTPELIEGLIDRNESLGLSHVYMMDIDARKLEIVGNFAKRMFQKQGLDIKVELTDDRAAAVSGADFVLAQIRVGMMDARIRDERIPMKYGLIGQETTGAGGFMNALRTVPVMMDIARDIEKLAPNAWLINFSNPSGIVAEALLNHTGVKTMGLCNIPITTLKRLQEAAGTENYEYDFVGLNHLNWITGLRVDGRDILMEKIRAGLEAFRPKNIKERRYDIGMLEAIGGIPCSYLDYFLFREEKVREQAESEKTRGEVCVGIEEELLALYSKAELDEKPKQLEQRGGALYSTAAILLIDAIANDKRELHVVNAKNGGALEFMGANDVVEIKCEIGKDGAKPVAIPSFSNQYVMGMMKSVKAYEKLAVEAALTGSYDAALAALLVNPLVGQYNKAKAVLDDMLAANAAYLPQFAGRG